MYVYHLFFFFGNIDLTSTAQFPATTSRRPHCSPSAQATVQGRSQNVSVNGCEHIFDSHCVSLDRCHPLPCPRLPPPPLLKLISYLGGPFVQLKQVMQRCLSSLLLSRR